MGKRKIARAKKSESLEEEKTENVVVLPSVISSDEPPAKRTKWINKQRVLVFSTRGILAQARHLMNDMKRLMPHSKREPKMDHKDDFRVVNEICETRNCNKCIFFEARKKKDLYMWLSNINEGPSAKFLVENVHTMCELKLTGNCLKGSRPLLSFDEKFDKEPHWKILKELFIQIFGTPNHHPKSQPFIDHVFFFSILDNRIWFRNYSITDELASLTEIGPRFVLNPVRIFEGSLGGPTLYVNPHYQSPNEYRKLLRKKYATKYMGRVSAKIGHEERKLKESYKLDQTNDVFVTVGPGDVEES
ncbi:BRX1 [Acanthosepion pharaonis]|uniref:Ribosome biogenesis protein BRX1 homolog n=1 Tax=Acanthosepion pharaonis TaxID=158019 RepID=A0A812E5G4_ACAPH|nr:BRX1 [Sepia pharaonis]